MSVEIAGRPAGWLGLTAVPLITRSPARGSRSASCGFWTAKAEGLRRLMPGAGPQIAAAHRGCWNYAPLMARQG